jgi:NAD(P)-dependent dehydrogenase (short-subunit alcohol dehydrogenase family)
LFFSGIPLSQMAREPMGRIGELEEVAFLCMPAASYMTGQYIYVDGARTITYYLLLPLFLFIVG